eukprot:2260391-Heterocapsa_arctica.AAC.1
MPVRLGAVLANHASSVMAAEQVAGSLDCKHAPGELPAPPLAAMGGGLSREADVMSPTDTSVRQFWLARYGLRTQPHAWPAPRAKTL